MRELVKRSKPFSIWYLFYSDYILTTRLFLLDCIEEARRNLLLVTFGRIEGYLVLFYNQTCALEHRGGGNAPLFGLDG